MKKQKPKNKNLSFTTQMWFEKHESWQDWGKEKVLKSFLA